MAFDKTGKYHMSPHHAKMADGFANKPAKEGSPKEEASESPEEAKGEGDEDQSDVPAMLEDLHAKHGGAHMHVHKHEAGVTTHHIGEDGVVEGPHEHAGMPEAAQHMQSVMGDHMGGGEMPMAGAHQMAPQMSGY